jgi:hypothetical protein
MTPADWAQYVCLGIAGAFGVFSLFDGTRRMAARQGGAGRTTVLGATIAGMLVAYSYWQHWTYSEAVRWYQPSEQMRELPPEWGKKMSPAKREAASQGFARRAYISSGTLGSYFDASGQRKPYAPAQDDVKRREAMLAAGAAMEQKALNSFNEFILWLVLGVSAFVFGLLFSFEPAAKPEEPAMETDPVPPSAKP